MTIVRDWEWEKKKLISPVTSVEFVGTDLLLSGNGPFLDAYSVSQGVLLNEKNLLQRSRIHGIRVENKHKSLVIIFGQKVIRVVKLQEDSLISRITFEATSDIAAFTDLIWDAHWLYDEEVPRCIAIATAHNAVWCWNWESNVKQLVAQCEELCILYSARFFGSNLDHLIIASGTVFNQVLLWNVQGKRDKNNRTLVLQRLTGHEGVIFSLNFNKSGTLLSSVSDDRSIRLWKVTNLATFESNGFVEPLLVVYGHAARVWDAKLLETCFVSIGEDLVCNVWNYDGNVVKTHKGHTGRNIWSLAVNQCEDLIATGGGDGSIRLWRLSSPDHCSTSAVREACLPPSNTRASDQIVTRKTKKEDYPRFVSLLNQANLLVMTNEGCLYKCTWLTNKNIAAKEDEAKEDFSYSGPNANSSNLEDQWTLLLKDVEYSSYSVLALSPCHKIIAFGNLKGKIKLQDVDFNHPSVELQAYSGKVHNLLWSQLHSPQHLFSCGPDGQITWWKIKHNEGEPAFDVTPLCSFILPLSKQRWASAIEIFLDPPMKDISGRESWTKDSVVVVCGDRKGSLHLFDPKNGIGSAQKSSGPVHSLLVIHGKAGVSHLCLHDNTMYSAGRDGVYRQLRIHNNALEVIDTKKVFKGLDWVERLLFSNSGDLIIAGFHSAYFVLWSVQRNELLWRVKCGGAHRVWDLALEQSDVSITGAVLSFIKDSIIYTHKIVFPSELKKSALKPGFHGREATCICFIDSLAGHQGDITDVFATGSEDTNIKLMISNRSASTCVCLFTAHGHISSVRALSSTSCPRPKLQPSEQINTSTSRDRTRHLLFSGGGRASLKCWRVDLSFIDVDNDSCHGDKMTSSPMVFLGEYSFRFSHHRRRRKKQDLQSLSEIRFMSLTSLCATELIDSCQSLYFVMAACSDGFVRIFSFDERRNKFVLLAQSQYLKRCVLTVSHVIDFRSSGRPLVMLFAGDTAGRISCWDVTTLLMNHIKEYCDFISGEYRLMKNVSDRESGNQAAVKTRAVCGEGILNKSSEKSVMEGSVSLEKCVTALKSATPLPVKENVTTDNVAAIKHQDNSDTKTSSHSCFQNRVTQDFVTDCHVNENVTNPEGCLTDTAESGKFVGIDHLTVKQDVANRNEQTAIMSETPDQSSLNDRNDQEFTGEFVEQCDFSCLPLVPVFLDVPTHVFQAHQSGVNDISFAKSQVPGQYLMVSGGDDSALYAAVFSLFNDNDSTKVHVTREVSEPSAHTSSVTGVKVLNNGLVISSSVDQRLVVWELVSGEQVPFVFRQRAVEIVDIADVQDLEVWGERDDGLVAAVCGVGLQTFSLVGYT